MHHIAVALVLTIVGIFASILEWVCEPPPISGGRAATKKRWSPPRMVEQIWFDPRRFCEAAAAGPLYIGASLDPSHWDRVDDENWARQVEQHNRDGLCIANDKFIMQWAVWDQLPRDDRDTEYMRRRRIGIAEMSGQESTFMMTAYLREWQRRTLPRYLGTGLNVLDIGAGTGRSADMYQAVHARVWAVEPDSKNYSRLQHRGFHRVLCAGGGDSRIQNWIPAHTADVAIMVYSVTFFFNEPAHLDALIENVVHAVRPGGRFIIIGMDGPTVGGWFRDNGAEIDNSVFRMTDRGGGSGAFGHRIEISMHNPDTLVTAQTEYVTDFDEIRRRLPGWREEHNSLVPEPFYLSGWPAAWAHAQRLLVFQRGKK